MSFAQDLAFGQKYERELISVLKLEGARLAEKKCKEYDVINPLEDGTLEYYEVKSDRLAHKTGNIAIEFMYKGQPSGILTTKAHYWSYFIIFPSGEFDLYVIPTAKIIKKINNVRFSKIINGGDRNASQCYLFPKAVFEKYKIN